MQVIEKFLAKFVTAISAPYLSSLAVAMTS
jgi:hypothetical protein